MTPTAFGGDRAVAADDDCPECGGEMERAIRLTPEPVQKEKVWKCVVCGEMRPVELPH